MKQGDCEEESLYQRLLINGWKSKTVCLCNETYGFP